MIRELIQSMRPKHWYKNVLLFVGLVFSLNLNNFSMYVDVIIAFIIFCILSGVVYIINDIIDIDKDRLHPRKRERPIASGKLKLTHAGYAAGGLTAGAIFVSITVGLVQLFVEAISPGEKR